MEEELENENDLSDEEIEEVEASIVSGDESEVEVTEEELAYFIGKNAEKYLPKFRKFNVNGGEKFSVTWNWAAFFFSYFWMAYRKMYVWAIAAYLLQSFFVGFFLPFSFLPMVAFGMIGNYLYYKHANKKIVELETSQTFSDSSEKLMALQKTGGVNVWAVFLLIIGTLFFQRLLFGV